MKDYCIELVEKLGAMKESKEIENALYEAVTKEVERLGGNPVLTEAFKKYHAKIHQSYMPNIHTDYEKVWLCYWIKFFFDDPKIS